MRITLREKTATEPAVVAIIQRKRHIGFDVEITLCEGDKSLCIIWTNSRVLKDAQWTARQEWQKIIDKRAKAVNHEP